MTETTTAPDELANQFASVEIEALKKTFIDLNEMIYAKAKVVSEDLLSLKRRLEDLLPYLADMQSFLSQRGNAHDEFRNADLPSWTAWFAEFKKKTGLNVSIRAVQKQIARLRGAKPKKRPEPPVNLSQRDQRRLLSAQQCANEMVAAMEHGADYSEPLREYKRVAMGTDKLTALLDETPEIEPKQVASLLVSPAAAASLPDVETATAGTESTISPPSTESIPVPKSGDWCRLVANVNALGGTHLKAVLADLPPDVAANVFGQFAQKLAQTYCHYEYGVSQLRVTVEAVRLKPKMTAKEMDEWLHGAA